ncbi:hypothetical protein PA3071 [hydrothermal vent metagenome]|uniref:DUF58 domain-containing protein n=1 Tax=hydrothermal vent metagenome TaxID=652676 RepID=A0A3B0ZYG8_9ZZZZ
MKHDVINELNDDIVEVQQQNLIRLSQSAKQLPLKVGKIRSQWSGGYLSPFKGRGMEFDEVRPYQVGDEIRNLDWRVMARTGKPYTKMFREERERSVLLFVDLNVPMFFATQKAFKSVIASYAASLLAWSANFHGDRVGGLIFSEQQHIELRPKRGKKAVIQYIQQLAEHRAWADWSNNTDTIADDSNSTEQALFRLQHVTNPGSLIFMISDFRGLTEQAEQTVAQLAKHNDIVLLFIYDPIESELPPKGMYRVSNQDSSAFTLDTNNAKFRVQFHENFMSRKAHLVKLCQRYGMYFLPLCTQANILATLQTGLGVRRR